MDQQKILTPIEIFDLACNTAREIITRNRTYDKRFVEASGKRIAIATELPDPCIIAKQKDFDAFRKQFLGYDIHNLRAIVLRYQLGTEGELENIERKKSKKKEEYVKLLWQAAKNDSASHSPRQKQSMFNA